MREAFIIPLLFLGFYGKNGFSNEIDSLFYFKIVVLSILYVIISTKKVEGYDNSYDDSYDNSYRNLEEYDECENVQHKTEVDLQIDRSAFKNEDDYMKVVQAECINSGHCLNIDENSHIKCFYKDSPIRNKRIEIEREDEKEIVAGSLNSATTSKCGTCEKIKKSFCKMDDTNECDDCDIYESTKDCEINDLTDKGVKECKKYCFGDIKQYCRKVKKDGKIQNVCVDCNKIVKKSLCDKLTNKAEKEKCKKKCYPKTTIKSNRFLYFIVYIVIPISVFYFIKNRTYKKMVEESALAPAAPPAALPVAAPVAPPAAVDGTI